MLRIFLQAFLSFTILLLTNESFAAFGNMSTPKNQWRFDVAPYLWAINMNGRVQVAPITTHIDQDFSQILKKMNIGGMLFLDAYYDKWDIYFNGMYAELTDGDHLNTISANATDRFGIFGIGAAYQVYEYCFANDIFSIEPYAGARYTRNDVTLEISHGIGRISAKNNQDWIDPLVGARLRLVLDKTWSMVLSADVGGVNTSKQYSYNIMGLIGYKPQTMMKHASFYLGYRLLDQRYQTGHGLNFFDWNMKLYGPMAGVVFDF